MKEKDSKVVSNKSGKVAAKQRFDIGSIDLPWGYAEWFRVISKTHNQSMRAYVTSLVVKDVMRYKPEYTRIIWSMARQLDVSWDTCFNLMLHFKHPYSEKDLEEASKMVCPVGEID